jgi:glycosyltransferase involved in cell wall biosynthesis
MRILIATDVQRQKEAGTAGVLLNYEVELQKLGHEVESWFLDDVLGPKAVGKRFTSLVFSLGVSRRILNSGRKYDVVLLHIPVGCVYGLRRRVYGSKGTPPYVFVMQGILERYGNTMRREQRKGRAWYFAWKNRAWFRVYHRPMYEVAIRTADYGVASNREAWTYPETRFDPEPGRLWYVPNGVEDFFFTSREYKKRTPLRLLYVGTWLDRKGVYYLADAFRLVLNQRPDAELTVAGCLCPEETVKALFVPEIRDRVKVRPYVKRESMPELYGEHDIFVFPSLMEGMPLSLLEAMATAMPVVSTETCGMADVVEDDFNGLLVPPADAERLAAAVEQLCDSVELRERLGQEAQRTMRRYTWERVTRKLEMVLAMAVKGAVK